MDDGAKIDAVRQFERVRPLVLRAFGEGSDEHKAVEEGLSRCAHAGSPDSQKTGSTEDTDGKKKPDGKKDDRPSPSKSGHKGGGCCFA